MYSKQYDGVDTHKRVRAACTQEQRGHCLGNTDTWVRHLSKQEPSGRLWFILMPPLLLLTVEFAICLLYFWMRLVLWSAINPPGHQRASKARLLCADELFYSNAFFFNTRTRSKWFSSFLVLDFWKWDVWIFVIQSSRSSRPSLQILGGHGDFLPP